MIGSNLGRGRLNRRRKSGSFSSRGGSSEDDEYLLFNKEWRSRDRRGRRFTKQTLYQLHERAEEVHRGRKLREEEREERLQEMTDVLDEMEDHISDYKSRKDIEFKKGDKNSANQVSPNNWKKYPKPGSKPKVTFKPDKFLIKRGFLYKKGLKWTHWKKRFFRIFLDDPHSLYYYNTPQKAET